MTMTPQQPAESPSPMAAPNRWLLAGMFAVCLSASLGLVWSLGLSLAAAFGPRPGAEQQFTLSIDGGAHPDAMDAQAWAWWIVADGRRIDDAKIDASGTWERQWGLPYPMYVHRGDREPAALRFSGRQAVVALRMGPWSGRGALQAADGSREAFDLYSTRYDDHCVVGMPFVEPRPVVSVVAALVLSALLAAMRPWRTGARTRSWLVVHLVLLHALVWSAQWGGINEDSKGYFDQWQRFVLGSVGYFPPGYGALLALAQYVPGLSAGLAATLLQHAMMVASLLWIDRVLELVIPRWAASTWLLLVTFASPVLFLPQNLMSENMAVFTVAGSLWFTCRYADAHRWRDLALAGGMLGWGVVARGLPILVLPALMLVVFATDRGRRALQRSACLLVATLAVVLAAVGWSVVHGGKATISTGLGRHLYNRVVCEQGLRDEGGAATQRLHALLPTIRWTQDYHWDIATRLQAVGVDYDECDVLLGAVAQEAIRKDLLAYIAFSFPLAWRDLVADPCTLVNWYAQCLPPWPEFEASPVLVTGAPNVDWRLRLDRWFGILWPVACWLAALGVLSLPFVRRRTLGLAVAWSVASYIVACGFLEYHLNRYNVAITPLAIAVAFLPLGCWRPRASAPAVLQSSAAP